MKNIENTTTINTWLKTVEILNTTESSEPISKKLKTAVKEVRAYSFNRLRNNWFVRQTKNCPRCKTAIKKEPNEKNRYINYFCYNCQLLFRK